MAERKILRGRPLFRTTLDQVDEISKKTGRKDTFVDEPVLATGIWGDSKGKRTHYQFCNWKKEIEKRREPSSVGRFLFWRLCQGKGEEKKGGGTLKPNIPPKAVRKAKRQTLFLP